MKKKGKGAGKKESQRLLNSELAGKKKEPNYKKILEFEVALANACRKKKHQIKRTN